MRAHSGWSHVLRTKNSRSVVSSIVAVFCVAFLVKFVYVHERMSLPDADYPTLDSKYHHDWAMGLAYGEWTPELANVQNEPYFRAPLYPFFVATIYRLLGPHLFGLLVVQAVIGSLSVVLTFLITRAVFSPATSWIAAAVHLGYWPFTYFEGERLIAVLAVFLNICLVGLVVFAGRRKRTYPWVLAGGVLGISAIARPNILATVPVVIWWIFKRSPKRSSAIRWSAVFVASIGVFILPVSLRNVFVGHDLVMIASQGGVNFYIGNNPESNGVTAVVPGTRADWWGGGDDARRLANEAAGRELRPSETSRYWYKRGFTFWFEKPAAAIKLYLRKAALLLGDREPSNNRQLYFQRGRSHVLSALPVHFSFILGFSLLGLAVVLLEHRRSWDRIDTAERVLPYGLAFSYAVSILIFFVTSRYRLPVVAWLVPGAAYGVHCLWREIRARKWKTAAVYGGVAGLIISLSIPNYFHVGDLAESRGYYALGVDFSHTDLTLALDSFDKSIQADPGYAPAWKMRGQVWNKLGQRRQAVSDYRRACELDANFAQAFYELGVAYQELGQHDDALPLYSHVLKLQPDHIGALTNSADVLMRHGHYDEALSYLERAIAVDPDFPNAVYGLGYYYEQKGELAKAAEQYRRISDLPIAKIRLQFTLEKLDRGKHHDR